VCLLTGKAGKDSVKVQFTKEQTLTVSGLESEDRVTV
jgi:hypothetical protein